MLGRGFFHYTDLWISLNFKFCSMVVFFTKSNNVGDGSYSPNAAPRQTWKQETSSRRDAQSIAGFLTQVHSSCNSYRISYLVILASTQCLDYAVPLNRLTYIMLEEIPIDASKHLANWTIITVRSLFMRILTQKGLVLSQPNHNSGSDRDKGDDHTKKS
jgi:hypothetical protein